jgi:hypothetical protein
MLPGEVFNGEDDEVEISISHVARGQGTGRTMVGGCDKGWGRAGHSQAFLSKEMETKKRKSLEPVGTVQPRPTLIRAPPHLVAKPLMLTLSLGEVYRVMI